MFLTSTLYGSPAQVWKLLSLLLLLFTSGIMKVSNLESNKRSFSIKWHQYEEIIVLFI